MGSPPVQGLLLNRRWVTREQYLKFEKEREKRKNNCELEKRNAPLPGLCTTTDSEEREYQWS